MFLNDTLVLIPARGGSKGIPGKNIKLLGNKPLIHYTIEVALDIFPLENICLSTDSQTIIKSAEELGLSVPFIRPSDLATDIASSYEVIMHALNYYKKKNKIFKKLVLLQPTSPFRKPGHIYGALKLFKEDLDMVISVVESKANPYFVLYEENNMGFLTKSKKGKYSRRQDCPKVWQANGAIYVFNVRSLEHQNPSNFKKIIKYPMESQYSVDIDTPLDWAYAEYLLISKLLI